MDPRHPLKVVITVEGGMVTGIWLNRVPKEEIAFLIADYDVNDGDVGVDTAGDRRALAEETAWVDTVKVRQILNKSRRQTDETS
jgi:hypothetical protein